MRRKTAYARGVYSFAQFQHATVVASNENGICVDAGGGSFWLNYGRQGKPNARHTFVAGQRITVEAMCYRDGRRYFVTGWLS